MMIQAVSVADAVADELRHRLLAGHYRGGEQLRDTELSAEFGVARPTVRAAVQMLVADGLLVRGRGRSAEVRSFTAEDAVDLYRLRRPIEETAVSMVIAERRGLDGVQSSVDAFTGMAEGVSWDLVADHDIAFHRAVLVAAGSPRLLRTFDEAGAELRLLIAQLRPAYASVSELAAEHASLLQACENALWQGLAQAQAGHRLGDISHAVEASVRGAGRYGVVEEYTGHGIGTAMHMDPPVPNYGRAGRGPRLRPGMALAIEPMVMLGGEETVLLEDGWTVITADGSWAAHFEHTVAITDDGPWVLTAEDGGTSRLEMLTGGIGDT